jgi:hypothetical protein
MKRIIRLTESDLTRIVRRVISEQKKTPMIDGATSDTGDLFTVVLSNPVASAGAGYKGTPSVQVKFQGMKIKSDGSVVNKGNMVLYGICGRVGDTVHNPGAMSTRSTEDVITGNIFKFSAGGPVDAAARQFCQSKGAKELAAGFSGDRSSHAKSIYDKVA